MASWVVSNYLYLFVRANSCILFILFFKSSVWNRAETELKCNTGLRETVQNFHFSYTGSWYLVPFSSNTFGDRNHKASHFILATHVSHIRHLNAGRIGGCGSRIHSKIILNEERRHKYTSCNSNAWQSERGFILKEQGMLSTFRQML